MSLMIFQQACGYEFTNKLHRMFTDVSISTSLNKEFLDFIQSKENVELGVNFSIMVLQVTFSSSYLRAQVSFSDHDLSIVLCWCGLHNLRR